MKILVPLADGFEEIEALATVDVLRRADVEVVTAATAPGPVEGRSRIKVTPDALLEDVKDDDFDVIVLPGGMPGTTNLAEDNRVIEIVKRMDEEKKIVAAICAATIVLKKAGVIRGRAVTCHPSVRKELSKEALSNDRVVVSENLVTSRGPGTAIEFALKLVELLVGNRMSVQIRKGLLARV
ncbi:MAG: DJ-1 family glyoxalase III [Thermodesulfobacteriota bacterium]